MDCGHLSTVGTGGVDGLSSAEATAMIQKSSTPGIRPRCTCRAKSRPRALELAASSLACRLFTVTRSRAEPIVQYYLEHTLTTHGKELGPCVVNVCHQLAISAAVTTWSGGASAKKTRSNFVEPNVPTSCFSFGRMIAAAPAAAAGFDPSLASSTT